MNAVITTYTCVCGKTISLDLRERALADEDEFLSEKGWAYEIRDGHGHYYCDKCRRWSGNRVTAKAVVTRKSRI